MATSSSSQTEHSANNGEHTEVDDVFSVLSGAGAGAGVVLGSEPGLDRLARTASTASMGSAASMAEVRC